MLFKMCASLMAENCSFIHLPTQLIEIQGSLQHEMLIPWQLNPVQCKYKYEGNSESNVPYFIHTERIPALSWQAWVVSTYIHHHIAVEGKFAPERFPINWKMNIKPCLGQSLMLLQHYEKHCEAFLSRFYRRKDFGLPLHPRQQGWTSDLEVKVMDTVFCNVYWVLLVVFTPQFNNKCRELYRNSRRLFGKRDQDNDQRSSSFAWQCATSQCCHNYLLTSWGWEILPHPPHSPDFHRQTSIYSQRWKSTSDVSTSTPIKMFKMK